MSIYEKSVNEYLEMAASRSPTPGGGSVSAVVAANAAAMVGMVARLTIGKKSYSQFEAQACEIADASSRLIDELKELTAADMVAFEALMLAWRMPADTDGLRASKREAMETATRHATNVPMRICTVCVEIAKLAGQLAPFGNKSAISDAGVAVNLAEGAMNACMLSVDINLPGIGDREFAATVVEERTRLMAEMGEIAAMAMAVVRHRMADA